MLKNIQRFCIRIQLFSQNNPTFDITNDIQNFDISGFSGNKLSALKVQNSLSFFEEFVNQEILNKKIILLNLDPCQIFNKTEYLIQQENNQQFNISFAQNKDILGQQSIEQKIFMPEQIQYLIEDHIQEDTQIQFLRLVEIIKQEILTKWNQQDFYMFEHFFLAYFTSKNIYDSQIGFCQMPEPLFRAKLIEYINEQESIEQFSKLIEYQKQNYPLQNFDIEDQTVNINSLLKFHMLLQTQILKMKYLVEFGRNSLLKFDKDITFVLNEVDFCSLYNYLTIESYYKKNQSKHFENLFYQGLKDNNNNHNNKDFLRKNYVNLLGEDLYIEQKKFESKIPEGAWNLIQTPIEKFIEKDYSEILQLEKESLEDEKVCLSYIYKMAFLDVFLEYNLYEQYQIHNKFYFFGKQSKNLNKEMIKKMEKTYFVCYKSLKQFKENKISQLAVKKEDLNQDQLKIIQNIEKELKETLNNQLKKLQMFVLNDFADALSYFFIKEQCTFEIEIQKFKNKTIFVDKKFFSWIYINQNKQVYQQNLEKFQKLFKNNQVNVYFDGDFYYESKKDYTQVKNLKLNIFKINFISEYQKILSGFQDDSYWKMFCEILDLDSYINFNYSFKHMNQMIKQLENMGANTFRSPSFSDYQIAQDFTNHLEAVAIGSSNQIFLTEAKNFGIAIQNNNIIFCDLDKIQQKFKINKKDINKIFFWIFLLYSSKKEFNHEQRFQRVCETDTESYVNKYLEDLDSAYNFIKMQISILGQIDNLKIALQETSKISLLQKIYLPKITKYFRIFTQCKVYNYEKNSIQNLIFQQNLPKQDQKKYNLKIQSIPLLYYNLVPKDFQSILIAKNDQITFKTFMFRAYSRELQKIENNLFFLCNKKIIKNFQQIFFFKPPLKFLVKSFFKKQFYKNFNYTKKIFLLNTQKMSNNILQIDQVLVEYYSQKQKQNIIQTVNSKLLINCSCLMFLDQIKVININRSQYGKDFDFLLEMSKHEILEESLIFIQLVESNLLQSHSYLSYYPYSLQFFNNLKKNELQCIKRQAKSDLFSPSLFEVIKQWKDNNKHIEHQSLKLAKMIWQTSYHNYFQCTHNNQEIYQLLMIEVAIEFSKEEKMSIQVWESIFYQFWDNYEQITFLSLAVMILKTNKISLKDNDLRATKASAVINSIKEKFHDMIVSNFLLLLSQFQICQKELTQDILKFCPFSEYSNSEICIQCKELMFFYCILTNKANLPNNFQKFLQKRIFLNFGSRELNILKELYRFLYIFRHGIEKGFYKKKSKNLMKQIEKSIVFLCQIVNFMQTQTFKTF